MKADYERQTSDISAVLTRLNAERAELANGVDNEHPALVAFMKYQNIEEMCIRDRYREAQRQMREAVAIKANIDHLLGITDERENKAQER